MANPKRKIPARSPLPQLVKVGPKGVITIPEENRRAMALEPGRYLTMLQVGNMLLLSPEINEFRAITQEVQAKMAAQGLRPEDILKGQAETRRLLYEKLYGHDAQEEAAPGA